MAYCDQSSQNCRQCPWRQESPQWDFRQEVLEPTIQLVRETRKMSPKQHSRVLSNSPPRLQFRQHHSPSPGFTGWVRFKVCGRVAFNRPLFEPKSGMVTATLVRRICKFFAAVHARVPRKQTVRESRVHTAQHSTPTAVRAKVTTSPNSNISDLEDEDSVIPDAAGGTDTSETERLPDDDTFPLLCFRDCRAIWAIRRKSMFSSGGNRRQSASPTVGSTSCVIQHTNLLYGQ